MDDGNSLIAAGLDGLRDGLAANPSGHPILDDLAKAHHVVPWSQGGLTNIDNLTLVCGWHHVHFELGYRCHMQDGVPYWTAPAWLEPDQIPKRNTAHRPMRT